jgi:hypothetical protein
MQWHRNDDVEATSQKPFIVQSSAEPTRYKMAQVNSPTVFEFVNDLANNAAPAVCGDGCVKVDPAVGTVGACKCACYGTLERFRAFLAKWRHDTDSFCFALIAEILASSNASPADCADRWIEKRYGRL